MNINNDIVFDLEECASKNERLPKGKKYKIKIDGTKYDVDTSEMEGREILALAGKTPVERYRLSQKMHGGMVITIALDNVVDFTEPGIEKFMTLALDQTDG